MDQNKKDQAICFHDLLAEELEEIQRLRDMRAPEQSELDLDGPTPEDAFEEAHGMNLVGLAFSGGGIRSATFNLGILQGLAAVGLLRKFDYLSTVSGGGYIGSWLEAWILRAGQQPKKPESTAKSLRRVLKALFSPVRARLRKPLASGNEGLETGIDVVEADLKPDRLSREGKNKEQRTEPRPIRFLREYSNYLTPRTQLLGADTWTLVAIYLRNMLLNQSVLTLFLFTLLLVPYNGAWITNRLTDWVHPSYTNHPTVGAVLLCVTVSVMMLVALSIGMANLKGMLEVDLKSRDKGKGSPFPQKQKWIIMFVVAPIFLAAWILTAWLWNIREPWVDGHHQLWWVVGGFVMLGLPWFVSSWIAPKQEPVDLLGREIRPFIFRGACSLFMGAASGFLMSFLFHDVIAPIRGGLDQPWHELTLGVPLTLLVFLIAAALQIGLLGTSFPDPYREWWARVAGWIFILTIIWAAGFGVTFYAPLGLMWLRGRYLAAGGIGWIASTAVGVFGAKSSKTGDLESNTVKDSLLSLTPYVFIVGLISLFSLSLELILANLATTKVSTRDWHDFLTKSPTVTEIASWVLNLTASNSSPTVIAKLDTAPQTSTQTTPAYIAAHWNILHGIVTTPYLLRLLVVVFLVCLAVAWRVDLNEFSLNLFYRNRLVRCYLGATHTSRDPNPFDGFDSRDDLLLQWLRADHSYSGPFPIFNATLNLVSTKDLAWQERKAESFTMTPLRCGFDTWLEEVDLDRDYEQRNERKKLEKYGYRPTNRYAYSDGGFYVGTAVSISGAALSPNMGYHSQPALAMLMTFFNVRLGFWAGNPRHEDTWSRPGPKVGLRELLAELFGFTDDESKYVYLSDGGHFENLGVYELVKRRCKYIFSCDAGADPNYTLEDLGNAIRKCREDIGVEINVVSSVVVPPQGKKKSPWHFVVGEIRYDMVDAGAENGIFVYVKASLTGDEPPDVLNYQSAHPDFPNETTADQWFTESQFESYRRLGQHTIETMFPWIKKDDEPPETEILFSVLREFWGTQAATQFLNKQAAPPPDKTPTA